MVGTVLDPPIEIPTLEFELQYFQYRLGQHVSLFGPTGVGKTTRALRMLAIARADHPIMRSVNLVMKPDKGPSYKKRATGDETVERLTRDLGGRVIRRWPPRLWWWQEEPSFWTLWPKHSDDPLADRGIVKGEIVGGHAALFRDTIMDCYRAGARSIFADEMVSLDAELHLREYVDLVYTKGRSMECGLWGATQRPAWVTRNMYSMASHLFLWSENDLDARKRYGEIARVDRSKVLEVLDRLTKHQCLYLNPDHPTGPKWAVLT